MVTLDSLKLSLRQKAMVLPSSSKQPLSDTQYSAGFDILMRALESTTYQDFVVPQLSQLLGHLLNAGASISVLEIGPGPKSVLGYLPSEQRCKITRYAAFEPNGLFASNLREWLCPSSKAESPLPNLERLPNIHQLPFNLDTHLDSDSRGDVEKFNIIVFCHSMYGMKPKHEVVQRALGMLPEQPQDGLVVVFHRDTVPFNGLVCHRTALSRTSVVWVAHDNQTLDCFAAFIAGFSTQDEKIRSGWRNICSDLGRHEVAHQGNLRFTVADSMAAFTRHATALSELMAEVLLLNEDRSIKNSQARLNRPAAVIRPTEVQHIQQCVRWALSNRLGLTVISGGHSGHCLWPNIVAVDMSAFDRVHILSSRKDSGSESLIVAEAGCTTGDIVSKAMEAGLAVPLGARPSVGAGLWLQGGIGHLSRLHGLACDAIVGAVVISVASGEILSIGCVPSEYRLGGMTPPNELDLLWAIKGAGTNFGIVLSVTFKAHTAPIYWVGSWVVPLSDRLEALAKLNEFDKTVAKRLPRNCSADVYLYSHNSHLNFAVTTFETSATGTDLDQITQTALATILGPQASFKAMDGLAVFEAEMYMSEMHGGHGGGKTSSFKRCMFLKGIGEATMADILVAAVETRPTPLCYLHLLQGGGAVSDMAADYSAFGCRDWDFACVVTGVWPRDEDGTETAVAAVRWVYKVARELLPLSSGAYGADLGPDSRDAALAARAFGLNLSRLARLKDDLDPCNVLAYACPLARPRDKLKLVILVTGESGAGKDYCAEIWVSVFTNKGFMARTVSISEVTKSEYAAATGADLNRLLQDRDYKEQHRPALTTFFHDQVQKQPRLPEMHFLSVVHEAKDMDVLLITGIRDEAPVETLSHLVPESRLLEVRIETSEEMRLARLGCYAKNSDHILNHHASLTFPNITHGSSSAETFARSHLLPLVHPSLQMLAAMACPVPDFPRPGIDFRHVLNISQQPGGLNLCSSLLQTNFTGDWAQVSTIACVEVGGLVYASALAARVHVPLALIREAGKLPPPTVEVVKETSHITGVGGAIKAEKKIEMEVGVISKEGLVVVLDDVLATGKTLCAMLRLLCKAGVGMERVSVIVVAEFPFHRARALLRQQGFAEVRVQSLLTFSGA